VSKRPSSFQARTTQRPIHTALTVLGAGGVVLSFVPFAFDYLPIRDAFSGGFLDPSWWSVLPCMALPLLAVIGYGIWLKRGLLPRRYATSSYVIVGLSIGSFLVGLVSDFMFTGAEIILYPVFGAAFLGAVGLVMRGIDDDPRASLIAIQAVYIVQMQFWLALATGEFQAGAWLGAMTSLVYLAQITLVVKRRAWLPLLLVPAPILTILILGDV
jgi:hypothetical protein